MTDHPILDDSMQEIVESFVVETKEICEGLEGDILRLEQTPDDDELVDQIFRAVHTVKGTSGFLSLEQFSVLAHHFEEVLGKLRDKKLDFQPAMTDVMLDAFDHMKILLQQVIDRDLQPLEIEHLIEALDAISDGTFEASSYSGAASVEAQAEEPAASPSGTTAAGTGADADVQAVEEEATEQVPETDVKAPKESQKKASEQDTSTSKKSASAGNSAPDTIRVEVSRLNALMDLVGELVLGRNRLLQLVDDVRTNRPGTGGANGRSEAEDEDVLRKLGEASDQVDFTTTELQSAVMQTRMVQIGRVFGKFPRVVRDLAREFGKQIDLEMEGEDTELDKSLVEEIGDPLVHLIRNAADHGIEGPEERKEKGKDPCGQIRLTAGHEGNHIVIEIADDGAGLDPDVLKAKAQEKNVISAAEAEEMSDAEAHQLIFRPGFSTAKSVSQVSGRGVGMDVVKTNLAELNGTIDIDSTLGEGTTFRLKLPLTLAIIQSMLVRSGTETFAVPLYAVVEAIRLEPEVVETIRGSEVIHHRDRVLPLVRLNEALDVQALNAGGQQATPADHFGDEDNAYVVIVSVAHRRVALVVDDLIAQEEVVIKSLGDYLKAVPGIAGSTILGDGQVIMILDIGELVEMQAASDDEAAAGDGAALSPNGQVLTAAPATPST